MCLYYHNNNNNHKHNHNIMLYNNKNIIRTLSSSDQTSTTNVIGMPSRRHKIEQQQNHNRLSNKNNFSDLSKIIMHQSGVVLWWCLILCTSFILDVSGSPVIRIQKDLASAKDNADSSLNLGCAYKGNVYSHRSQVQTEEPCLNCTCSHSTLICYLRVCPDLPDPPPVGCIVLQRYQVCCPELICTENRKEGNRIESRSELDASLFPYKSSIGEGCVSNGTIYAEGSAMLSSSECEHCFCLAGQMSCVKPKCLLPLKGCEPIYEKNSCCPIRYDCQKHNGTTSTTETHKKEVCHSNGSIFYEGEKVVVPGHSICDNCYCFRGKIHCEHLSCAPTLMGCEPIIPPEKCCATSYNCSGTIEVKPNGFYAKNPPDVSKNYAKLRKEQHVEYISNESNRNIIPTEKNWIKTINKLSNDLIPNENHTTAYSSFVDGRNNRRIDRLNNQSNEISNHIDDEIVTSTSMEDLTTVSTIDTTVFITTDSIFDSTISEITTENDETITTEPNLIATTINFLDDGNQTKRITNENMSYKSKTEIITVENCSISNDNSSVVPSNSTIIYTKTVITTNFSNGTSKFKNNTVENNTETVNMIPNKNFVNNTQHDGNMKTDFNENNETVSNNNIQTKSDDQILEEITSEIAAAIKEELLKSDDAAASMKELNVTEKNHDNTTMNISIKTLPPDIEAILNITKIKNHDFEDYDYNEPSLPPSLPNLKIIPFVAADAVDERIDPVGFSNLAKDKILVSDNPIFRYDSQPINLFSPPIETEGGFLPRDPPIIDSFYDNSYHTTNIVDITSVTPVPSITNPPKINEICFSKGREYKHGELLSPPDSCVLCMCFFGDIVCQEPKCPPLKPGCTRLPAKEQLSCCGHVICDNEAPTVVLDRIDSTSNSQNTITIANRITTPDPFRDVIRTEPAPDLQSLIGDIIPFLKSQETTTAVSTTKMASTTLSSIILNEYNKTINSTTEEPLAQITTTIKPNISEDSPKISIPVKDDEDDFSFDKVLELFFASETTTEKSTVIIKNDTLTDSDLIESRIVNNNFDNGINYLPLKFPSNLKDKNEVNNGINSNIKSSITPNNISTTTESIQSSTTTERHTLPTSGHSIHHNNLNEAQNSVGLLKLAGCNIYGRMYRVGRIISELSGPCLECMCTDIGVQCRPLKC